MTEAEFSTKVHRLFWATAVTFVAALALIATGWITGSFEAGFAGAAALAVSSIVAVRWMDAAEAEAPNPPHKPSQE